MTLLVGDEMLRARRTVAAGPLSALTDGLSAELAPLHDRELYVPPEKALLSREGGRCPRDGSTLEFDPFSPRRHRCSVCGNFYEGELHDRFWVFWYQLWLAERAVHAALLGHLRTDSAATGLASSILRRYVDQYLLYPNRDNVLGPTRVFFSTYLESIWLLNLCIAVDLLEMGSPDTRALGDLVRDRIVEPSAALIASYDEHASNRQVWNDAALLAAGRLLGHEKIAEAAVFGPSGVVFHLGHGLLADGTWYEGENYHLFAHRGLWYGVTMAEHAGLSLPDDAIARFQEGFAAPFLTALPDMTLPSRRDSQYAISLRQPRFAELCELGLSRESGDGDPRLRAMLHRLYRDEYPRRDTGRGNSTADVERNRPGTRLSRADLGWRSLLFARPVLPSLADQPLGSVLLEEQGIAVFRRSGEHVYAALDYGRSGGGHGHPDRLNVLLSQDETRWLDDMGTGSYVDRSLHWYRSTLAHNAPMFDGRDQTPVDGALLAFEDREQEGWVSARAVGVAPGVTAERSLVVLSDYMLDEVIWESETPVVVHLPLHVPVVAVDGAGERLGAEHAVLLPDPLHVLDDIVAYACDAGSVVRIGARAERHTLTGFVASSLGATLCEATAPGPPGRDRQRFVVLRIAAPRGRHWIRAVWSWSGEVQEVAVDAAGATTCIIRSDGAVDEHRHLDGRWSIRQTSEGASRVVVLAGGRPPGRRPRPSESPAPPRYEISRRSPLILDLAESQYRRSEESWQEAGRPAARVTICASPNELALTVEVRKYGDLTFAAVDAANRYDNEAADINGDGVQLYVRDEYGASAWVLVPDEAGESTVRARPIDGWADPRPLTTTWQRTAAGYTLHVSMGIAPNVDTRELVLGLVVNEMPPGRQRRRGQLVLGGEPGAFVYLRGDREDCDRLPRIRIVD